MTHLIGLYSSAPQCGKSTVAEYLRIYDFVTISFATPLKVMTRLVLKNLGYPPSLVKRYMTDHKEEVIPNIGVSARHMMRTLGTEWGRDCIHPEIWLMCWRVSIESALRQGRPVVCDDVRFPNEAELIQRLHGELWHISRTSIPTPESGHRSDGALDGFTFDLHLNNDGSLVDLYEIIDKVLPQELTKSA